MTRPLMRPTHQTTFPPNTTMPTTTRITIPVTITIEVAHGVDPMTALDDILVAAERGTRRACTDATAGVTRIRFDADLDDAEQTTV